MPYYQAVRFLSLSQPSSREWSQRSRERARQEMGPESAQQNLVQKRSLEPVSLKMVPDTHVNPLVHAGFPYISSHVMLPAAVQGEQQLLLLFQFPRKEGLENGRRICSRPQKEALCSLLQWKRS